MRIPFLRRKPTPEAATGPGTEEPELSLPLTGPPRTPEPHADLAPVSLEAVLAKGTLVQWVEGVAVLSGVCATAIAARPDAPRIPEPSDIAITAEGTVLLRGGRADGDASRRLARMLHELLAAERIPAQLRLFISTSIGSPEPRPIPQFAREIEYFARPDGAALIRALHDRYLHGPAKARPAPPNAAPAATTPPRRRPRAARRRRGRRVAALAALAVLGAGAAATWTWARRDSASAEVRLEAVTDRLRETARDVRLTAGTFARSLGLDLPGLAEEPGDAAAAEGGVPATAAAPRVDATPATSSAPPDPDGPAGAAEPTAALPAAPQPAAPAATAETPPVAPTLGADERPIYSSDDLEVEPPVMTYPQVPPPPDDAAETTTIEVVISATGEVEQALMLPPARRLTDAMLVSNAKAWRFEPARRDGEPVRYRLRVELATSP